MAIQSFACKRTEVLFQGGHPREFRAFESVATRKLRLLNVARTLDFLRSPPGNRLEALKGDRKGQHSLRCAARQNEPGSAWQGEPGWVTG